MPPYKLFLCHRCCTGHREYPHGKDLVRTATEGSTKSDRVRKAILVTREKLRNSAGFKVGKSIRILLEKMSKFSH